MADGAASSLCRRRPPVNGTFSLKGVEGALHYRMVRDSCAHPCEAPSCTVMLKRRYLTSFSQKRILHRFTDVIVIGGGIAGLRAALRVAEEKNRSVIVLSKGKIYESNSDKAQGGIATVLEPERTGDTVENHIRDTMNNGCAIADKTIVEITVDSGIERVRELISWGAQFDKTGGLYDFTMEGGHSKPRILHANGDSTGHEILNVLLKRARKDESIQIFEESFAIDFLVKDNRCYGVLAMEKQRGMIALWAPAVILASGGYGRLFRETTNGPHTTGDGIAMAYRAGVDLQDLEFIQFHPTTLYIAGSERLLITEAARGEGGILRDNTGKRFMTEYHPRAELAPRDVVSRAILDRINKTNHPMVYLDLSVLGKEKLAQRFPRIVALCKQFDINPMKEPIPIRPSAHYTIGGVKTDSWGQTSLEGLYACGEVACTGLHGANRLGSNSLLEGLVFGYRSGCRVVEFISENSFSLCPPAIEINKHYKIIQLDKVDMRRSLESLMVRSVGILRNRDKLQEAHNLLLRWADNLGECAFFDTAGWELQNMVLTSLLIIKSALWRRESRGTHFREDFPETEPEFKTSHIIHPQVENMQ